MSKIYLISDTHFNHKNILTFEPRPWATIDEMNKGLIRNWNAIVQPEDKVYHLGDVSMNKNGLLMAAALNGHKILIKGNHDKEELKYYLPIFEDIRGSHQLGRVILTHFPLHPTQKYRYDLNIHGHLHGKRVVDERNKIDPWYYSVCVEHIDYKPILLEDALKEAGYVKH